MSRTLLSLAGFQVIISGRFWVIAEGMIEGVPVGELDFEGSPRVQSGKIDTGCYQRK
jgi:hypothetical protein